MVVRISSPGKFPPSLCSFIYILWTHGVVHFGLSPRMTLFSCSHCPSSGHGALPAPAVSLGHTPPLQCAILTGGHGLTCVFPVLVPESPLPQGAAVPLIEERIRNHSLGCDCSQVLLADRGKTPRCALHHYKSLTAMHMSVFLYAATWQAVPRLFTPAPQLHSGTDRISTCSSRAQVSAACPPFTSLSLPVGAASGFQAVTLCPAPFHSVFHC